MDGGEKLRSADLHQQFDSGVEVTKRTLNRHRVHRSRHAPHPKTRRLPADPGRGKR